MRADTPPVLSVDDVIIEMCACSEHPFYFIDTYCQVYDATSAAWIPFVMWRAQIGTLDLLVKEKLVIALKARQLGFSWLVLSYALWLMLFQPAVTVLLFSKRDDEAVELLDMRLKEMYRRLPDWLRRGDGKADGKHDWILANGSRAKAFPTTGGRSYTGSLVIVDEADFVPDLNVLLNAVKPTVDAGGQLILLSTSDKSKPESTFKRIYRAARVGENPYRCVFHGWRARPGRDDTWYEEQRRDILARTGSLDDLHQEYPATDTEALAPRSLDKRLAAAWLEQCRVEQPPLDDLPDGAPAIPGLTVYLLPQEGRKYVLGADPAEGNPTSDDSSLHVLDMETGEECAVLAGKYDPTVFAGHIGTLAAWYNKAAVLVERNNHGHAVLLWLRDNTRLELLRDLDGKEGWHTTSKSKAQLWTTAADAFRGQATVLHSFATFIQLASIEGGTLRAPENMHDDQAISYALALQAVVSGAHVPLDFVPILRREPYTPPSAPEELKYPGVRWFAPTSGWQPRPTFNGEAVAGAPDMRTEEQAGLFLHVFARLTKQAPPPFPEPSGLDAEEARQVQEKAAAFCRVRRLL